MATLGWSSRRLHRTVCALFFFTLELGWAVGCEVGIGFFGQRTLGELGLISVTLFPSLQTSTQWRSRHHKSDGRSGTEEPSYALRTEERTGCLSLTAINWTFGRWLSFTRRLGWAAGGLMTTTLLHTEDGGRTWLRQLPVPCLPSVSPPCTVRAISFASPLSGVWVGSGALLHTEDGGRNWSRQNDPNILPDYLWDVTFVSPLSAWAVGSKW